ncbi:ABC transporter ATP-binding protein [Pleionea sp. CnH1-48]|uniref:ABC transporter ATP-binding protein n=1 Tax=Pleionea sp. CnH1-48 TaxID=2954494 RepID=UPI0020972CE1|nr:ABC transporter ATP-binding protein [Pleionea sp. CnH1-48]MCO7226811.1 ABC transporter ATP-binding protein [Pleionea sp. CnH1-48]
MTDVLTVNNLSKHYGDLKAVNDISFTVKKGHCFGLLGPNGAGKTTTLEILEGINSADSGDVHYPLIDPKQSLQQHIGIQFQNTALQDFIRVKETLVMFADLYGSRRLVDELIELCSLQEFLDRDCKKLSGGQRQRLLLALALIHDPDIVFLDEPTTGLDPQSRRNFWQLVKDIKARGKTLVLTTHYMDEAHQLCDDIAIMDHGKIIEQGSPESLLQKHFSGALIRIPKANIASPLPFEQIREYGDTLEINSSHIDQDLKRLIDLNVSLEGLYIHNPNLDDLFLKLTGHELRA